MSFIPKKIKDLFKKEAKPKKTDKLKPFLQKEGYYLLDLEIKKPETDTFLITSPDLKGFCIFYKMKIDLAALVVLDATVQVTAKTKFDMNHVSVFFKHKDSDLYINGKDKNIGLPLGTDYQIVLIPKACKWRPEAKPVEEFLEKKPTVLKPPM